MSGVTVRADRDDLRRRIGELLDLPWVRSLSDPRGGDVREVLTGDRRRLSLPFALERLGTPLSSGAIDSDQQPPVAPATT